jgi:hypothetical protein
LRRAVRRTNGHDLNNAFTPRHASEAGPSRP